MAERQATPNTDDDPLRHLSLEEIDTRIAEAEATIARQEKIDRLRVLQQQLARPTSCPSTPAMPIIAEAHSRSDAGRLPMPKFDGTPDSFTSWVQTAALWFRNRGYADVIGINEDGSPTATTGTAHDPALEAAAREILLVHMLDHKIASALSLFQAGSAAKCWRVLFQAYSPSSLASVVRAVRDLVTVQHMPGESVATYAARVQAAAHRVRSTVPTEMLSLTDALVAVLILANASSDLDAVVAGLHNRALDTLPSVSEVVGSLTSEEIRVQDVRDRHDAFQTANRSSCATSTRPRGPRRNESCVFHPGSKHTNGECTLQRHIWYRDSNAKSNTSSPTSNEYPTSGAHPIDPAPEPMRALSARHAIDVYANSVGLLDSACSTTMTPLRRHLSCYRQGTGPEVELADLSRTTTSGRGVTSFGMDVQATSIDSLHVPRLGQALVSVGQLTRSGHKIVFDGDTAKIYSGANWTAPVGQPVAVSQRGHDNLYRIPLSAPTSAPGTLHSARVCSLIASSVSCRVAKVTAAAPAVWHARTGHLGYGNLRILHKRCRGMKFDGPIPRPQDRCPCAACLLAKGKRSSFPPSTSRARRVGDLVHSDLSGRWPVVGVGGFEYYQTMLDDSSRYLSVYLLRRKSEALDVIKHYDARLRNQEGRGIRTFQTDGGGEYNSKACVLFYNESGILHRKSVPYTPEQNGRAESVNHTLCGIESSIRCHSRMPDSTWPWSLSYSAILYNIHPRSVLPGRRTSFEAARRALPNISALRVYGCDAYAMRPHPATKKPSKLEPRRVRAVFIGFTPGMKAWRFYDVDREDTFESTTAEFLETSFTFGFGRSSPASSSSAPPSSPESSSAPNVDTIVPTPVSSDAVMAPLPSTSASSLAASPPEPPSPAAASSPSEIVRPSRSPSPDDVSTDEDDDDAEDDPDYEGSASSNDSPNEAADPDVHDNSDAADIVDHNVIDVPRPRRSNRRRQPPGEWWKAPEAANRSSTRWSSTVDAWFQNPTLTFPTQRPPRRSRRLIRHWQQVEERRLIDQAIRSNRPTCRGAAAKACRAKVSAPIDPARLPRPDLSKLKATDIPVPNSMADALSSPFAGHWWDAAVTQMATLDAKDTFGPLIDLPKSKIAVGAKWVFRVKSSLSGNGGIRKFTARLCAQGFRQRPGIDFDDTFAPTARATAFLVILALAAQHGLHLRQVDWVAAYLNADMLHDVYIRQPDGFTDHHVPYRVRQLQKALYGTKQGAERWYKTLREMLLSLGFESIIADPCVFRYDRDGKFMIMSVHTDDGLLAYNDVPFAESVLEKLSTMAEITDQGEPSTLLGMRIRREPGTGAITLDQAEYIEKVLSDFNMSHCHPVDTPHQPGVHLSTTMSPQSDLDRDEMATKPYLKLIGCLTWLAHRCRPDIAYITNVLAQFSSNPGIQHWRAGQRVLKYLAGTMTHGIRYERQPEDRLIAYADADWASDPDTRRSRSGHIILLAGGPVHWQSRRQDLGAVKVSLSSTHAEIKSLCAVTRQLAWIRSFLTEIGFARSSPTIVYEDNQGAKAWSGYRRMDDRTKDIEVQFHYTREAVEASLIVVHKCPSAEMAADYLTKPALSTSYHANLLLAGIIDTSPRPCAAGGGVSNNVSTTTSSTCLQHVNAVTHSATPCPPALATVTPSATTSPL
ncbi:Integrase catalytic domain-containing protein [Plasmodiophora brassicae]